MSQALEASEHLPKSRASKAPRFNVLCLTMPFLIRHHSRNPSSEPWAIQTEHDTAFHFLCSLSTATRGIPKDGHLSGNFSELHGESRRRSCRRVSQEKGVAHEDVRKVGRIPALRVALSDTRIMDLTCYRAPDAHCTQHNSSKKVSSHRLEEVGAYASGGAWSERRCFGFLLLGIGEQGLGLLFFATQERFCCFQTLWLGHVKPRPLFGLRAKLQSAALAALGGKHGKLARSSLGQGSCGSGLPTQSIA